MSWVDGHVYVNHPRHPWDEVCPREIVVHGKLGVLNGEEPTKPSRQTQYSAAKFGFDLDAGLELVQSLVSDSALNALIDAIERCNPEKLILVNPHPEFVNGYKVGDPRSGVSNAIPFAFSEFLAETLDGQVDEDIEQIARVGRTKMDRWQRFLYQPSFAGDVKPGAHYIIADDVVTLGATFAALRSHIVANGGLICAATAIAHSSGINQPFPIISGTVDRLGHLYGEGLFGLWKEALGHEIHFLTEPEGDFLCEWGRDRSKEGVPRGDALLQRVRARLDQAASNGSAEAGTRSGQEGRR